MPRTRPSLAVTLLALLCSACGLQRVGNEQGVAMDVATTSTLSAGGGQNGGANGSGTASGSAGSDATAAGGSSDAGGASGGLAGSGGTGGTSGGVAGGTGGTGGSHASGGGTQNGLHGTISIGYVNVTGFSDLAKSVNVNVQSFGDPGKQTKIIADYVNSHGGIAGRALSPDVEAYNAQNASPQNETSFCTTIAGNGDAAVVLGGQIQPTTRACYQKAGITAFEGSNYGFGRGFYSDYSPTTWAPVFPDYDEVERALVSSLKARNWFGSDTKVGVAYWDNQTYADVVNNTLQPALHAAGISSVVLAKVSNQDTQSIESGLASAVATFQSQGVIHVMFVGSDPLAPFFMIDAQSAHAQFVYGLSSYDSPKYDADNSPSLMAGAAGIGFDPIEDVSDSDLPFPQPGMEQQCYDIYKAGGLVLPARINSSFSSKQAIAYCEETLLYQKVANSVKGSLTAASWSAAAEQLGTSMQMATSFALSLGPGHHAGAIAYRTWAFDSGCPCNKYSSGNQSFS